MICSQRAFGQQHFSDCLSTINNATVVIPSDVSSDIGTGDPSLEPGDEIALFTKDGLCAGVGTWEDEGIPIAVAGTDPLEDGGYEPGEPLKFHVWDASAEISYRPAVTYAPCDTGNPLCSDEGMFQSNVLYTLSTLSARPKPLAVSSVTASREQFPNVASNTLDDDLSTRWSAQGAGESIRFTLNENASLVEVGIAWYNGDQRQSTFEIALSTDGSTWTTVHEGSSSGTTLGREYYGFSATPAKYVRITGYGNSSNNWNAITEVSLHGCSEATGCASETLSIVNVTTTKQQHPNVAANTLDNSLSTRWSANGQGVRIQYELSSEIQMDELGVAWYRGDKRTTEFDVALSTDGSAWTTVHQGSSSGTTIGREYYSFSATPAKYVRITGYGNTENNWTSITEVDIAGLNGASPSKPLPYVDQPPEEAYVEALELEPNYPNPFRTTTTIRYALPNPSHVVLDVFDLLGRRVARLVDRDMQAGRHAIKLDGASWPSGTYIYRLQVGSKTRVGRMTVVR